MSRKHRFFWLSYWHKNIYIYINMYMYYNPPALYDMWRITVHNDDSQSGFCGTTCWISMSTINCDEVSATCDNFHTTPYDACACFRSTYQNKGFDSSSIFFEENACNLHMIWMICILLYQKHRYIYIMYYNYITLLVAGMVEGHEQK